MINRWYAIKGSDLVFYDDLSNEEVNTIKYFWYEIVLPFGIDYIIELSIKRKEQPCKKNNINSYMTLYIRTSKSKYWKHLFRCKLKNKEGNVEELQRECMETLRDCGKSLLDLLPSYN